MFFGNLAVVDRPPSDEVASAAAIQRLTCVKQSLRSLMSPWLLDIPEEKSVMQSNPATDGDRSTSQKLLDLLSQVAFQLGRIADHFDPPPPDIVDTNYIADKLGCTTDWVAEMAREGEIPISCVILGTGDGKPWKFRRSWIDQWIERR